MSRSRFHQLIGSVFPVPKRDAHGRPYFDREQQQAIVEIRRSNVGVNGQPILFRATGSRTASASRKPKAIQPKQDHRDVLVAVRDLGLTQATVKDVEACVASLFPEGKLPEQSDLIRQVFLSLNSRFSRGNQA